MKSLQIVKADYNAHIKCIVDIERQIAHDAWDESYFVAEFQAAHSHVYVAIIGNVVVGFVIFWDLGVECEIINIAVAPNYMRKGIGDKMLSFALDSMGKGKTCFLEVDVENIPAIGLYNKYGFEACGEIKDYYGVGKHAFRMIKYL